MFPLKCYCEMMRFFEMMFPFWDDALFSLEKIWLGDVPNNLCD